MITFYCGVSEKQWNYHPVIPGTHSCISPVYGKTIRTRAKTRVSVPKDTRVLQDSGAFSDGPENRLSFQAAYDRQTKHAIEFGYLPQIEYRASYDLLIDEKWNDGKREKRRWDEVEAEQAIHTTINAASFLSKQPRTTEGFVLSAQGVSPKQYLECTKNILQFIHPERDVFGLGGWCIIGKYPAQMLPVFIETLDLVIPELAKNKVKKVHLWGVIYAPALAEILFRASQYSIQVSTDSSGPAWRPAFGHWGYWDWRDKNYQRKPVATRGLDRIAHVKATREWLEGFNKTPYYLERTKNLEQYSTAA